MITPPRPGEAYPGHLPPVREQWSRLGELVRTVAVGLPVLIVVLVTIFNPAAGGALAILFVGTGLATIMFVKNRSDRHNAAVDRGEIRAAPDPHFRNVGRDDLPSAVLVRLEQLRYAPADMGKVMRFDQGWIVRRKNPRDVAVLVGDDGEWAHFDPRLVTDLWAVSEYLAGRGHESPDDE
jgi:hypothetical protein